VTSHRRIEVLPVPGLPEFAPGDSVAAALCRVAKIAEGDVVAISQKVVSKAEGRLRRLVDTEPGEEARRLAARLDRDARLVELILSESAAVLRAERGALITRTRQGFVCANAGIDSSNMPADGTVALLPEDPDGSAREIRAEIRERTGRKVGVIVTDSFGRAWRVGQCEVAIGCAGLAALDDWRGRTDAAGRELGATLIAVADQAAAASDLVRDKTSGTPISIVRGLSHHVTAADGPGAAAILRPEAEDLFL
jgi:coenzyme F420-0:L-glutamate ligase/coenzyme F420-1:gamma-L-glutamate ligase